jgi:hypothetical protein
VEVKIYDAVSKLVLERTLSSEDVANGIAIESLKTGVYILDFTQGEKSLRTRFIVE